MDWDRLETDHPDIYRDGPTPKMIASWDLAWRGRRIRWPGEIHGAAECREYGFWVLKMPAGDVRVRPGTPGAVEDFETLLARCVWDVEVQRFVLPGSLAH